MFLNVEQEKKGVLWLEHITFYSESKEELKSLNEGERGEWKAGLKLNIQKAKIMASSPITSQQINGGGGNGNNDKIYFLGLQNYCRWWLQPQN